MTKVQLASDIHLEQNPGLTFSDVITSVGNVLCLAGDIGCPRTPQYQEFLRQCSLNFPHTIVIAGNHEYRTCAMDYNDTMVGVDAYIETLCAKYDNVYYLAAGARKVINGINFIGATLWSQVNAPAFSEEHVKHLNTVWGVQRYDTDVTWSVDRCNRTHEEHLTNIAASINWGLENALKNVIVTHHSPIVDGPFKIPEMPRNLLYASDLKGHIDGKYMTAWFFGHTHYNYLSGVNGTLVFTNQYGAKGIKGWSGSLCITI